MRDQTRVITRMFVPGEPPHVKRIVRRVIELPVERIYFDHDRSFGADLDDPERRFEYYMDVWERALGQGES